VTWRMHAQRRKKREQSLIGGNLFFGFGSESRAGAADGDGLSAVELIEDPFGNYWGWLPDRIAYPIYISDSEDAVVVRYQSGDTTRDISTGQGRIVRLAVRELERKS